MSQGTDWKIGIRISGTADKRCIPVECTVQPLQIAGRREGTVVAFRDISERQDMEEELRWQANHDPLTKLLNRRYFENQLDQEVLRLSRSTESSALLYIDLDKFKYINDTAGHAAGDQLLIEIAECLQSRIRASDLLSRLGGDEFAFILRNIEMDHVYEAADKFRQMLADHTFMYRGRTYKINGSIGVAIIDNECGSASQVMSEADLAANIAKEKGRNQTHVYNRDNDEVRAKDMELGWSVRLQTALKENSFVLNYQPILPMSIANKIHGCTSDSDRWKIIRRSLDGDKLHCEALIRMPGINSSQILPGAFIPSAERFNLMKDIDLWVMERVFVELGHQSRLGHRLSLSINLSAQTIVEKESAKKIRQLIRRHGVNPEDLVFEIDEASAIENFDAAQSIIRELRNYGCELALGGFGSGFCSFSHLKHLDVNTVKIDGSCVKGAVNDAIDEEVVIAINQIAQASGKKTVAEYVENGEILEKIVDYGVDYVQGFHIAEPLAELPSGLLSNVDNLVSFNEAS